MKHLLALAALSVVLAANVHASLGYSFEKAFSETHPLDPSGEIVLSNPNGKVSIQAWDRSEVQISGKKRARTQAEFDRIGVTIDPRPAQLLIKTLFPRRDEATPGGEIIRAEVDFTIMVPAGARLREIETVNGPIVIEGVKSSIVAQTNGSLRASFAAVIGQQQISLRTVNGSITLDLPKSVSAAVRAQTVHGRIDSDFTFTKSSRTRLSGNLGAGDAQIDLNSTHGRINIEAH